MSGPSNPTSDSPSSRSLAPRPTTAQREAAEERLRRAAGDGQLTLEEYGDRVALVLAATTPDELRAVTADLSVAPEQQVTVRRRTRPGQRLMVAVMGSHEERGRWRPAQDTQAIAVMGSVELDLREAEVEEGELTLNATAVMGSVEIVVPDEVEVEMTGFAVMGDRQNKTRQPASDAAPLLRINAYALMGSVEVRNPNKRERKEAAEQGGSTALAHHPSTWTPAPTQRLPARRGGGLPQPVRRLIGLGVGAAIVVGLLGGPVNAFSGSDATAVFGSQTYQPTSGAELGGGDPVEARALFGSVEIIVPEGHRVADGGGNAIFGSRDFADAIAAINDAAQEGAPTILVRGSAMFGSVDLVGEAQLEQARELRARIEDLEDEAEQADDADDDALEAQLEQRIDELEEELDDVQTGPGP